MVCEKMERFGRHRSVIREIYEYGNARRAAVSASGVPEEVLADEINACAADVLGDVLLEENDAGSFEVIEDYRELLDEILNG